MPAFSLVPTIPYTPQVSKMNWMDMNVWRARFALCLNSTGGTFAFLNVSDPMIINGDGEWRFAFTNKLKGLRITGLGGATASAGSHITIDPGAEFRMNGDALYTGNVVYDGTLTANGAATFAGAAAFTGPTVTMSSGTTLDCDGPVTFDGATVTTSAATVTNLGGAVVRTGASATYTSRNGELDEMDNSVVVDVSSDFWYVDTPAFAGAGTMTISEATYAASDGMEMTVAFYGITTACEYSLARPPGPGLTQVALITGGSGGTPTFASITIRRVDGLWRYKSHSGTASVTVTTPF